MGQKAKFIYVDGPFDGRVGEAFAGVTEFWKKHDGSEYHYSRISKREFKHDKIRVKKDSDRVKKDC